jgi:hypothetical protein
MSKSAIADLDTPIRNPGLQSQALVYCPGFRVHAFSVPRNDEAEIHASSRPRPRSEREPGSSSADRERSRIFASREFRDDERVLTSTFFGLYSYRRFHTGRFREAFGIAGNGRRLRSGSQPVLGRLWVTVRGHYGPLPWMAGMENPGAQAETPAFENLGLQRAEGTSREVRRVSEARS